MCSTGKGCVQVMCLLEPGPSNSHCLLKEVLGVATSS